MRNPIGLAAGFDKSLRRMEPLGELGFGYVVGGTITRHPRKGNPKPRIVRDPGRRALINSMGLPNPGAVAAARNLARARRTATFVVSVADEELADAVATAELLAPFADAFELNASSPNAPWGHRAEHVGRLVEGFRERVGQPVLVKVPPFDGEDEFEGVLEMARAAIAAGSHGLVCSNTVPVREPRLASGRGGLSGEPLRERTPTSVRAIREATGNAVPIVACGGVGGVADVIACLEAGATSVQLYTSLIYRGPGIVGDLTRGLTKELRGRASDGSPNARSRSRAR